MPRYVCLHGHFYQPPRENPWIEVVERQASAHPYHDWNERVTAECYAPNASSRILDGEGRIVRIVNNYARISFNFGPTLLKWLEDEEPDVYEAILEADRESAAHFGGHGSAMAQVYNHAILPLCNHRDRRTQVVWGIRDFRHRFGRDPEGMWLAETAVDVASLEALASEGIRYTVLAPGQAEAVRPPDGEWRPVSGTSVDPTRPYRVALPSGREIAVFFYDGELAQGVAFGGLLRDGARFAQHLVNAFPGDVPADVPALVHLATDGETYGHHHRHGEMALSYALREIEESEGIHLTNYSEFLERHPPEWEARIDEASSWSCAHGVERWRSDCGCHTGGDPSWTQEWRGPLRDALDWLRDRLEPLHEERGAELFHDPWAARDAYIDVILDRDDDSLDRFFSVHGKGSLDEAGRVRALRLLEIQRHALLMYTSCGWFFNELSGIETVQVLQYAGRAVQLAEEVFDERLEQPFLDRLQSAVSNLPLKGDGRRLYEEAVLPARVDLEKVGAHYAVSSLFEEYGEDERVYCYRIHREALRSEESGNARMALGRVRVSSVITRESAHLSYGVVHLGAHTVVGGVRVFQGEVRYRELAAQLEDAFERADFPAVIRLLDAAFRASIHSLRSLLGDEQRRILARIFEEQLGEAERTYARLHGSTAPLLRFLKDLGMAPPRPFRMAAEYTLNLRLRRALEEPLPDADQAREALEEAERLGVEIDAPTVGYVASNALERVVQRLLEAPESRERLREVEETADVVLDLPFAVSLWGMQNRFWELLEAAYPRVEDRAERGDAEAAAWVEAFRDLGRRIGVAVEEVSREEAVETPPV